MRVIIITVVLTLLLLLAILLGLLPHLLAVFESVVIKKIIVSSRTSSSLEELDFNIVIFEG